MKKNQKNSTGIMLVAVQTEKNQKHYNNDLKKWMDNNESRNRNN